MSAHDEAKHPRDTGGRWAPKTHSEPGPAAALTNDTGMRQAYAKVSPARVREAARALAAVSRGPVSDKRTAEAEEATLLLIADLKRSGVTREDPEMAQAVAWAERGTLASRDQRRKPPIAVGAGFAAGVTARRPRPSAATRAAQAHARALVTLLHERGVQAR